MEQVDWVVELNKEQMLSSKILNLVNDQELCEMIDELQDFKNTGILKPGKARLLIKNDAKIISFSSNIESTIRNIYEEAALRFRSKHN